ncbi:MAG TPA: metal-dependent transcriptional regulator [Bryobacteraceae bacterium]|nr:metal-dependent transcriptional regulator [Bryobacteraceae bacterium]
MQITISKENYLKAIAEAEAEGEIVIAATLARWLNVSAPAVTMASRRLRRDGLIEAARDGQITLTAAGREIAERLIRRHYLIERMLTEVFDMEWYKVHDEAEQLEHAVSADFEAKLADKLGDDKNCPHGFALGLESKEGRLRRGLVALHELAAGKQAAVVSVFERDRGLLEYLDGLGIKPGAMVELLSHNADQTVTLLVGGCPVPLGRGAAEKVWVSALPALDLAETPRSSQARL